MKKNIILILLLAFFVFSCGTKDADVEFYNLGTEMLISTDGMTSLDVEAVITVENPLKNLSAVDIVHEGIVDPEDEDEVQQAPPVTDLGTINLTDGTGSITISESDLGISTQDWTAYLMFNSGYDNKEINRDFHISVASPFSTEDPGITYRSDTSYHFNYSVEPVSATVTGVTIETKVGKFGTYVELPGPWPTEDSIEFVGAAPEYSVYDTIYVKITATTGTKTDSDVSKLVIAPNSTENSAEFKLDMSANIAFDLLLGRKVNTTTAGDSADVAITSTLITGGFNLGLNMPQQAELVAVSALEYNAGDTLFAQTADYVGQGIQTVPSVVGGETYVYRTRRGTDDYSYGFIKVVAVVKPNGVLEESYIDFEYKY